MIIREIILFLVLIAVASGCACLPQLPSLFLPMPFLSLGGCCHQQSGCCATGCGSGPPQSGCGGGAGAPIYPSSQPLVPRLGNSGILPSYQSQPFPVGQIVGGPVSPQDIPGLGNSGIPPSYQSQPFPVGQIVGGHVSTQDIGYIPASNPVSTAQVSVPPSQINNFEQQLWPTEIGASGSDASATSNMDYGENGAISGVGTGATAGSGPDADTEVSFDGLGGRTEKHRGSNDFTGQHNGPNAKLDPLYKLEQAVMDDDFPVPAHPHMSGFPVPRDEMDLEDELGQHVDAELGSRTISMDDGEDYEGYKKMDTGVSGSTSSKIGGTSSTSSAGARSGNMARRGNSDEYAESESDYSDEVNLSPHSEIPYAIGRTGNTNSHRNSGSSGRSGSDNNSGSSDTGNLENGRSIGSNGSNSGVSSISENNTNGQTNGRNFGGDISTEYAGTKSESSGITSGSGTDGNQNQKDNYDTNDTGTNSVDTAPRYGGDNVQKVSPTIGNKLPTAGNEWPQLLQNSLKYGADAAAKVRQQNSEESAHVLGADEDTEQTMVPAATLPPGTDSEEEATDEEGLYADFKLAGERAENVGLETMTSSSRANNEQKYDNDQETQKQAVPAPEGPDSPKATGFPPGSRPQSRVGTPASPPSAEYPGSSPDAPTPLRSGTHEDTAHYEGSESQETVASPPSAEYPGNAPEAPTSLAVGKPNTMPHVKSSESQETVASPPSAEYPGDVPEAPTPLKPKTMSHVKSSESQETVASPPSAEYPGSAPVTEGKPNQTPLVEPSEYRGTVTSSAHHGLSTEKPMDPGYEVDGSLKTVPTPAVETDSDGYAKPTGPAPMVLTADATGAGYPNVPLGKPKYELVDVKPTPTTVSVGEQQVGAASKTSEEAYDNSPVKEVTEPAPVKEKDSEVPYLPSSMFPKKPSPIAAVQDKQREKPSAVPDNYYKIDATSTVSYEEKTTAPAEEKTTHQYEAMAPAYQPTQLPAVTTGDYSSLNSPSVDYGANKPSLSEVPVATEPSTIKYGTNPSSYIAPSGKPVHEINTSDYATNPPAYVAPTLVTEKTSIEYANNPSSSAPNPVDYATNSPAYIKPVEEPSTAAYDTNPTSNSPTSIDYATNPPAYVTTTPPHQTPSVDLITSQSSYAQVSIDNATNPPAYVTSTPAKETSTIDYATNPSPYVDVVTTTEDNLYEPQPSEIRVEPADNVISSGYDSVNPPPIQYPSMPEVTLDQRKQAQSLGYLRWRMI